MASLRFRKLKNGACVATRAPSPFARSDAPNNDSLITCSLHAAFAQMKWRQQIEIKREISFVKSNRRRIVISNAEILLYLLKRRALE